MEVTITVTEVSRQESGRRGANPADPNPPRRCPVCGSPWLPDLREALGKLRLNPAQLKLAATEGRLHLFCSPDNEVWVCERSIQEIRGDSLPSRFSLRPM